MLPSVSAIGETRRETRAGFSTRFKRLTSVSHGRRTASLSSCRNIGHAAWESISPQNRHLIAFAWIVSAQNGQTLVSAQTFADLCLLIRNSVTTANNKAWDKANGHADKRTQEVVYKVTNCGGNAEYDNSNRHRGLIGRFVGVTPWTHIPTERNVLSTVGAPIDTIRKCGAMCVWRQLFFPVNDNYFSYRRKV